MACVNLGPLRRRHLAGIKSGQGKLGLMPMQEEMGELEKPERTLTVMKVWPQVKQSGRKCWVGAF